jgi:hypothetical protein
MLNAPMPAVPMENAVLSICAFAIRIGWRVIALNVSVNLVLHTLIPPRVIWMLLLACFR